MSCRLEEAIKDIEILAAKPGAAKIAKELIQIANGAKDKLKILDSINIQKQQNDDREYDSEVADKLADKLQKLYGNIEVMYLNGQEEMRQVLEELSGGLAMFQLSNKRKQEFETKLRKARPDLDKTKIDTILKSIEEFSEKEAGKDEKLMKKLELLALHWTLKGNVILPEDAEKVMQAVKTADKNKVDVFAYTSPDVLMDAFEKIKEEEELLDPDTLLGKGFTNKLDIGKGVILYDVDNNETGRTASRKILDNHYSETKNPWCLLVRDENGLTKDSEEMWYKQYPGKKRIAFQDGKLISFYGGEQWWDIQGSDMAEGVPITVRGKFIEFEDRTRQVVEVSETDATKILDSHGYELGLNKKGHIYKRWDENKQIREERLANGSHKIYYLNGVLEENLPDGSRKIYYENGQLRSEKLADGSYKEWYGDGQIEGEISADGSYKEWYKNGQLKKEKLIDNSYKEWYENGQIEFERLSEGTRKNWYEDGQIKYEELANGSKKRWYDNGQLEYEILPNEGMREWYENGQIEYEKLAGGLEKEWHKNGQIKYEELANGSKKSWYDNGQIKYEVYTNGDRRGWYRNGQIEHEYLAKEDKTTRFQKQDSVIKGAALLDKNKILIDIENRSTDTLAHEYAHFYVAAFRDTPIVQEAIKKFSVPDVILPIGTSGSGKSTWINSINIDKSFTIISPDEMRVEFTGNMNDKSKDPQIYEEAAKRAITAIKSGAKVIFDTTNLTADKRVPFVQAIKKAIPQANITYKLMPLDPELAKQRIKNDIANNVNRANVPDSTIDRHAESYKQMLKDIQHEDMVDYEEFTKNGEEELVQAIGEQAVKQKGEVYGWWKKFSSWIKGMFEGLDKASKEKLVELLTDAFLTKQDLSAIVEASSTGITKYGMETIKINGNGVPIAKLTLSHNTSLNDVFKENELPKSKSAYANTKMLSIDNIVVYEEFMRKGYGKNILDSVIDKYGNKDMFLWAFADTDYSDMEQSKLEEIYKKLGFKEVKTKEDHGTYMYRKAVIDTENVTMLAEKSKQEALDAIPDEGCK